MEVIVKQGWAYTNISVACAKADGTKIDPTVIALNVYLVDQTNGTLGAVASSPFTPVKQDSKTGWYGYSLNTELWDAGQYKLLIEATVDEITTHWSGDLVVSEDLDQSDIMGMVMMILMDGGGG